MTELKLADIQVHVHMYHNSFRKTHADNMHIKIKKTFEKLISI